jgi:Tol biopolymer transport system component
MRYTAATLAMLGMAAVGCGEKEGEQVWDDGARFFVGSAYSSDTSLAWSPTGSVLLYTSTPGGNPDLYGYDRVTSPQKVAGSSYDESVGPNGCWTSATDPGLIAYSAIVGDSVALLRTRTGNLGGVSTLLTDSLSLLLHPSWSPDAGTLVFALKGSDVPDPSWDLYTAQYVEGEELAPQKLIEEYGHDLLRPSYSADGELILYQRSSGGQHDIWVVGADGTDPSPVIHGSSDDVHPCWAPYQGWFVFSSNRDGDYEIYASRLEGDTLIRITDDPSDDLYPAWNPEIPEIVFSADRSSDNFDIYYIAEPDLPL